MTYREETGVFRWKKALSNRVKVGEVAGSFTDRYVIISIDSKRYVAHRLAWLYVTGKFPNGEIDHVDQDTKNNRFNNLRDVTSKVNAQNKPKRRDNKSGITGVSWDKTTKKWVVRIKDAEGKYRNRGRFTSICEAKSARDKALKELGYSERHGKQPSQLQYRKK